MQALIIGIAAAFIGIVLGIVLGFWLRAASAKAERAGAESLAEERAKTIGQLTSERDGLRLEYQDKVATESQTASRIKELETELRNERQNLQEKLTLLETAKEALANQFKALADEILEKKSKSFSDSSQEKLGTLLTPLK